MEHMVQIFLTSIVQGITEFLPISSSGHILFLNKIFNWTDVNLTIAVAVHLGTLIAVIKYFWLDIKKYFILGSIETFKTQFTKNRKNTLKSQMFLNILISTLPIIFIGFYIATISRDSSLINLLYSSSTLFFSTSFFAIILFLSDKTRTKKKFENLSLIDAFFIGIFQIFALIPGASRAGVCITAGRFLGYDRISATKYSMYLSVPTILGASFMVNTKLLNNLTSFHWIEAFFGFSLSFIFALLTIDLFLKILRKINLTIFVIYRIIISLIFAIVLV